jgi:hypothetical protein
MKHFLKEDTAGKLEEAMTGRESPPLVSTSLNERLRGETTGSRAAAW